MGEITALMQRQRAVATTYTEVWMDEVLGAAQRIVPLEEGTLAGSAGRETHVTAGSVQVVGYFATPYARYQHQMLNLKHRNGRQAKYLETPFKQRIPTYAPGLSRALKATL